jgi:outer membrane protein TolC
MNVRSIGFALAAVAFASSAVLPAAAQQPSMPATPPSAPASPRAMPAPSQTDAEGLPPPPIPPVLPVVPNVGQGYVAPSNAPLPNGDLVGIVQQPFVGINLNDAIGMALQRNTDLAISASNARIANYQIVAAAGAYDVQFEVEPQYQYNVTPALSPFQGGPNGGPITQISSGAAAGFSGQTQLGTRYSISANATSVNNNTALNAYNPFYETAIALQVTQPLLRGAGAGSDARHQLAVARANAQAQSAALLTNASQTVTNVSNAYWDLVYAWRDVAIQEEGLRNAAAQAASNQRLANRGAAAPVDVVESNTQVNVFQDNVFSALAQVQSLQTQLKSLILANPADPLWIANLVPTSAVLQLPAEPALDDLIVSALKNRPEVAQLRASRLIAAANLAYAKNQLKPQLDLGLGFTTNGFAGIPTDITGTPFFSTLTNTISSINALIARANVGQPPGNQIPLVVPNFGAAAPGFQTGGYGQSWSNLFNNRFPAYSVSLTLKFPLGNRTAKADEAIAEEQAKQVAVQELGLLQRIRAESVNALQSLRSAEYRLNAASAARVAAERVLLSEQRKFAAGTSTTFLVLQRQLDVANDQGRELQAQTDLNKAVVQLDQVAGTNFDAFGIDVSKLGSATLSATSPATSLLPSPAAGPTSPPPLRR